MKKLILVILVVLIGISAMNSSSSYNIKQINNDIDYSYLFKDADKIMFDISKSMSL